MTAAPPPPQHVPVFERVPRFSRPRGEMLYLGGIVVAGAADLAAFHQIVSLVMRDSPGPLVWLLVTGLTIVSLLLAHAVGQTWRALRAGDPEASVPQVRVYGGIWLVLGLSAMAIRLLSGSGAGAPPPISVEGEPALATDGSGAAVFSNALLFLALYLAAGAIAMYAAAKTYDPLLSAYLAARGELRAASRRLARLAPKFERARHVLDQQIANRDRDIAARQAARDDRFAAAEELKRYAEVLIATQLQDAAATDGMTTPDRRPWPQDEKPED